MVFASHHRQTGLTERRDRHRPGIIRVVLIRLARRQHPNPRSQHRRHIDDVFTAGNQLLGQQVAEPTGGLDRPHPDAVTVNVSGPVQEPSNLIPVRRDRQLTQHHLSLVDRNRRVGCLVRIDPNRGDHHQPPCMGHVAATVGTPDHNTGRLWRSPLSSHTPAKSPDGPAVRSKDTHRMPGTSRAKPAETPNATRQPAP
jgi:hypothetical protein